MFLIGLTIGLIICIALIFFVFAICYGGTKAKYPKKPESKKQM